MSTCVSKFSEPTAPLQIKDVQCYLTTCKKIALKKLSARTRGDKENIEMHIFTGFVLIKKLINQFERQLKVIIMIRTGC